jgi:hypothetical protein
VKFKIWTWGSCGRSYVQMLHPVKLDLRTITGRTGTVRTEWFTIEVVNMDSSKNLNREITFLDVHKPIIIHHYGAHSCSRDFEAVYLVTKENGNVVAKELPVQRETRTENTGRFIAVYEVVFIEHNGERIVLREKEVSKSKTVYMVSVKLEGDKVVVSGDTYEVKDTLKKLGLRWDATRRAWIAPAALAEAVKVELEKLPDVVLKQ